MNPSQSSGLPRCFLGVAVEGPSREGFFFYPTYRTKGDGEAYAGGNDRPRILPDGKRHAWSLEYDLTAAGGHGQPWVADVAAATRAGTAGASA